MGRRGNTTSAFGCSGYAVLRIAILVFIVFSRLSLKSPEACDTTGLGICGNSLQDNQNYLEWKKYFFAEGACMAHVADEPIAKEEHWFTSSFDERFVDSGDGRIFFFFLPSYRFLEKAGEVSLILEEPDGFVFIYDKETKNAFPVVRSGASAMIHDAFWLDEKRLVVLGSQDNSGIITCVDIKERISAIFEIDGELLKESVSEHEYLIRRHFVNGAFIWDYGGSPPIVGQ